MTVSAFPGRRDSGDRDNRRPGNAPDEAGARDGEVSLHRHRGAGGPGLFKVCNPQTGPGGGRAAVGTFPPAFLGIPRYLPIVAFVVRAQGKSASTRSSACSSVRPSRMAMPPGVYPLRKQDARPETRQTPAKTPPRPQCPRHAAGRMLLKPDLAPERSNRRPQAPNTTCVVPDEPTLCSPGPGTGIRKGHMRRVLGAGALPRYRWTRQRQPSGSAPGTPGVSNCPRMRGNASRSAMPTH